jgi:SAM-dependent methyltransferase
MRSDGPQEYAVNREMTNRIRYVLEDLVPPALRDSGLFRAAAKLAWGQHIDHLADFRRRAAVLTPEEYETLYTHHPRVHDQTDNSIACIERISADVVGTSVLDVGCGTGYLLTAITGHRRGKFSSITGVDFVRPEGLGSEGFEFVQAPIESLPFVDNSFDTVICTHVIEHILDMHRAISELRRVAARRLIVVVPCEREALYTFNPHFNFFPYPHSFLRVMIPLPKAHQCFLIGRDIYYLEDVSPDAKNACPIALKVSDAPSSS